MFHYTIERGAKIDPQATANQSLTGSPLPVTVQVGRQVRFRKTSVSEPLMTRRKVQDDVETGGISLTRDEPGGWPDCCPGGIRREGGVTLNQASMWNAGTCRSDAKGEIQIGGPYRDGRRGCCRWARSRSDCHRSRREA